MTCPPNLRWEPGGSDWSLEAQTEGWRLRFKPGGSDWELQAEIEASRLRLKPGGWDWRLQAQIEAWSLRLRPGGSDWGLVAAIEACRLRFKPGGSDGSLGLYLGMGWDSPDSGKWPAGPREPEIEDFIKRMCHISVRIWRGSRLEKNGRPS